jgi:internalin A
MNQNHLVYLPEELCECSNLKVINVGKNNLEKMPDTIYKLQELSFLICNDNCLTTLPDRMGELKCLKRINLSGNIKLKNWPSSLENLCNLKALDICCTSIPTIPENISKLTNLNALRLPYF